MTKLNGYLALHRNTFYLLEHKTLNNNELLLWQYFISQMDFDPKHDKYGTFEYFPDEIGRDIFHKGKKTIETWFKRLERLRLVYLADSKRSLWGIPNPARYVINSPQIHGEANQYEKKEKNSYGKMLENIGIATEKIEEYGNKFPDFTENNQIKRSPLLKNSPSIAKGSYKGDLLSYPYGVVGGEYNGSLSLDDQGWILSQRFKEIKI